MSVQDVLQFSNEVYAVKAFHHDDVASVLALYDVGELEGRCFKFEVKVLHNNRRTTTHRNAIERKDRLAHIPAKTLT